MSIFKESFLEKYEEIKKELPSPRGNESRSNFVSRCLSDEEVQNEFGEGSEQAQAVCFRRFREAKQGFNMNLLDKFKNLISGDEEDVEKGARLATFLNATIQNVADERGESRTSLVGEIAQQAGVDTTTVFKDLMGDIQCPPIDRIEAYSEILQIDRDKIISLGEADGCNYGTQKSDTEDDDMTDVQKVNIKFDGIESKEVEWAEGRWARPNLSDFPNVSEDDQWDDLSREKRASIANHFYTGTADTENFSDLKWPVVNPATGKLNRWGVLAARQRDAGAWADRLWNEHFADEDSEKFEKALPTRGNEDAKLMFVGASASKLDSIRGKLFTGPVGKTLNELYISEFDLDKSEIAMTNLVPVYLTNDDGAPREPTETEVFEWLPYLKSELARINPDYVVALGKTAKAALGDVADEWVPHPRAVNIHGATEEVPRKMSRLNKNIQEGNIEKKDFEYDSENDPAVQKREMQSILKADDELQVVKGIVLQPGVEDADGNWTTKGEIEKAAHDFMKRRPPIFREHTEKMEGAYAVENYVTDTDTEINGRKIKAGSWILGVKVEDSDEWQKVKEGEYQGFSFGGRAKIEPELRLSD